MSVAIKRMEAARADLGVEPGERLTVSVTLLL